MTEKSEFQLKLEFWIWITKGARFTANERCLKQNKWSNFAIGMLSAYILIVNLISVFQISNCTYFNGNHVAFYTTALSILILVFSQLENSNDFKLKALNYHNCALELSRVYRKVRSLDLPNLDDGEYVKVLANINSEYETVLEKYDNHKEIDYHYYRSTHPVDFNLKWIRRFLYQCNFYFSSIALYQAMIILPPLIIYYFIKDCK